MSQIYSVCLTKSADPPAQKCHVLCNVKKRTKIKKKESPNLLSVQTSTQTGLGFKAGVKDYRLTYYMKNYQVHVNDLLAAFRVIAQPGVPPEEAGAAIAAESSTGTWTTVWTDGLTSLDRYKGR